jgi:hypothetical protein
LRSSPGGFPLDTIPYLAKERGLSRQTVYTIKDAPAAVEAALAARGFKRLSEMEEE